MRSICIFAAIAGLAPAIAATDSQPAGAIPPQPPGDRSPLPPQLRDVGIDQNLNAQLPLELVFRDEDGRPTPLGKFFDGKRPVILTLVYYECPMLCTLILNDTLRSLRAVDQLAVNKDFQIVTVSFDPAEGPELAAAKKKHYLTEYKRGDPSRAGAESGWHFLTGDEDAIRRLTSTVGFRYKYDEKHKEYIHPSGIIILTPEGRVARYFFGIGYNPKDLRLSLVEASNHQIGSFSEQLLLYCFHYDPSTGKYSLAVMNAVKAGGVLTIIAIGGLFFWMSRRRKRLELAAAGQAGTDRKP